MTNYEKIKNMSIEELASTIEYLEAKRNVIFDEVCDRCERTDWDECKCPYSNSHFYADWLNREA